MDIIKFPTANNVAETFGSLDDRLLFDVYSAPLEINGRQALAAPSGQQRVVYREIDNLNNPYQNGPDYIALGVVGDDYPVKSHREYFPALLDVLHDTLPREFVAGATVNTKVAHDGAFALLDVALPNSRVTIETRQGFRTDIAMRSIMWHGLAGTHSNNVLFGNIDFFCTNGMVIGDFTRVKRKNTKNFSLTRFAREVEAATGAWYEQARTLQIMANTVITIEQGRQVINDILGNTDPADRKKQRDSKADKMFTLFVDEAQTRGANVFALLSAFTNYSSHTDNGFALRDTGSDHGAVTMLNREVEVAQWINNPAFTSLYREAA
jgi:hypothetical protein